MPKARIWEKNALSSAPEEHRPNPAIMRFLAKRSTTFSSLLPVDTLNTDLLSADVLPQLEKKGDKKVVTKVVTEVVKRDGENLVKKSKRKYVSYQLRSAFEVLHEDVTKDDSLVLSFITVNLSKKFSDRYRELGATGYGKKQKALFKRSLPKRDQSQMPSFIAVLEESSDGTLHAHLIMLHHVEDQAQIAALLRKEAKEHNNAVEIKQDYIRWLDAEPGTTEWELHELDLESFPDDNLYPYIGTYKDGTTRYYGRWPVDAGSVDYISKELHKPLKGSLNANKHYIDGSIKQRAAARYNEIRAAVEEASNNVLTSGQTIQEYTETCSEHVVLTSGQLIQESTERFPEATETCPDVRTECSEHVVLTSGQLTTTECSDLRCRHAVRIVDKSGRGCKSSGRHWYSNRKHRFSCEWTHKTVKGPKAPIETATCIKQYRVLTPVTKTPARSPP